MRFMFVRLATTAFGPKTKSRNQRLQPGCFLLSFLVKSLSIMAHKPHQSTATRLSTAFAFIYTSKPVSVNCDWDDNNLAISYSAKIRDNKCVELPKVWDLVGANSKRRLLQTYRLFFRQLDLCSDTERIYLLTTRRRFDHPIRNRVSPRALVALHMRIVTLLEQ